MYSLKPVLCLSVQFIVKDHMSMKNESTYISISQPGGLQADHNSPLAMPPGTDWNWHVEHLVGTRLGDTNLYGENFLVNHLCTTLCFFCIRRALHISGLMPEMNWMYKEMLCGHGTQNLWHKSRTMNCSPKTGNFPNHLIDPVINDKSIDTMHGRIRASLSYFSRLVLL